jgi:hypothetical protein
VLQRLHVLTKDVESDREGAQAKTTALVLQKFEYCDGLLKIVHVESQQEAQEALMSRKERRRLRKLDERTGYRLLIVDEAHHLYRDDELRKTVEAHTGSTTRRILLSDVSQSAEAHIHYPDGMIATG